MVIQNIEVFPVKVRKDYVYLGETSGTDSEFDYFLRPEYRCPYSKNMETFLVKVTDADGEIGWGEALAPVLPEVAGKIISKLFAPVLLGRQVDDIPSVWDLLYGLMRDRGYYTGFMVDAIAAVDCALWDLIGRKAKQSISQLLGGKHMPIPAYVSGLPVPTMEEKVQLAQLWKEKGFSAIKLQIGYGVREDLQIISALRKALGGEVDLMVDAHWNYSVADACFLAQGLQELGAKFLECPLDPEDREGYAQLKAMTKLPIALGEADRTRWQYDRILKMDCCDILQPDVGRCGISELMRISKMAKPYQKSVAPHLSVGQGGCIAATLHCDAALENFYGMQEFQPTILSVANQFLSSSIRCENGCWVLPEGVGSGIEFDEEKVRYYAYKED